MDKKKFNCVVIGGGPGGYVAAIRAAQRGLKTALVEKGEVGGTCLNRGCIPSKTLISSASMLRNIRKSHQFGIFVGDVSFDYAKMSERKDIVVSRLRKGLEMLIASNKIYLFRGEGRLISTNTISVTGQEESILESDSIILATGSEPRLLKGIDLDYKRVHDSTSLLNITKLPKRLVIIGGGIIGCEFASLYNSLDVEVTILEILPNILFTEDKNIANALVNAFKKNGIKIETGVSVQQIQTKEDTLEVSLTDGRTIVTDMVLVSTGRKYNSDNIGLEKSGVVVNQNGSIPVNDKLQTNIPNIYAIGDITGKWLLAHAASHQGLVAADNASGHSSYMHYEAVPSVIYTYPESASVGITLEKAISDGFNAVIGKFPFQALGKAQAVMETEGFAQVVLDKPTGQILGAQVVGYGASNLIAEIAIAINNELTVDSIFSTIHAHPTFSEAWMEAAFLASDLPLHMPPKP